MAPLPFLLVSNFGLTSYSVVELLICHCTLYFHFILAFKFCMTGFCLMSVILQSFAWTGYLFFKSVSSIHVDVSFFFYLVSTWKIPSSISCKGVFVVGKPSQLLFTWGCLYFLSLKHNFARYSVFDSQFFLQHHGYVTLACLSLEVACEQEGDILNC